MDAAGWGYAGFVDTMWQLPWSPTKGQGRPLIDKRTNTVYGYWRNSMLLCQKLATGLVIGNNVSIPIDRLKNTLTVPDTCESGKGYPGYYPYCAPYQYLAAYLFLHGFKPYWVTDAEAQSQYHFIRKTNGPNNSGWEYAPGAVPGGSTADTGGGVFQFPTLPNLALPNLSLPDIKLGDVAIPGNVLVLGGAAAVAALILLDD